VDRPATSAVLSLSLCAMAQIGCYSHPGLQSKRFYFLATHELTLYFFLTSFAFHRWHRANEFSFLVALAKNVAALQRNAVLGSRMLTSDEFLVRLASFVGRLIR
jgi:hypothetical protein